MTNELALELFHDFGIKEPDPRLLAQLVKIIKSRGRVMVMQAVKAYAQEDLMVKVMEDQSTKQTSGTKAGRKKKDAAAAEPPQTTPPVDDLRSSKEPEDPKENSASEGDKE